MYLVMNIGCIECGLSSAVVGVFASRERAEAIANSCDEKYSWREGGHNAFEVFELPQADKIAAEYEVEANAALSCAAGATTQTDKPS